MPKKKDTTLDDMGSMFLALPWWVGPIFVVLTFFLFRTLLPALAAGVLGSGNSAAAKQIGEHLAVIAAKTLPMIAPWMAGLVLLVWIVSIFKKMKRQSILTASKDLEGIRSLSWREFELLVGEYYRRNGFSVEERGGPSPDGGVDLVLRCAGRKTIVQCKHWKKIKVGVKEVRELCGIVKHEGANAAILVTSGIFTGEALNFSKSNGIKLVDGAELAEMLRPLQSGAAQRPPLISEQASQARIAPGATAPACPKCGSPMLLRTARTGPNAGSSFHGCARFPECRGTLPLQG